MPRWYVTPDKWKPVDTEFVLPDPIDRLVTCHAEFVKSEPEGSKFYSDHLHKWIDRERTHWTVTLTCNSQTVESPYNMGSAHDKPPSAQDVIWALALDAQAGTNTFEEFAGDFGYDTDSRSAFATWEQCRDIELRLRRMFGEKFDALLEWSNEQ